MRIRSLYVALLIFSAAVSIHAQQICGTTIPCALGWSDISGTTLKPSLCPNYGDGLDCVNVMAAFSGGVYDPTRHHAVIWGGGHVDYHGNEVYMVDMSGNPIAKSLAKTGTNNCPGGESDGSGNPVSRHTYDGEVYVADQDAFVMIGGSTCPNGAFTGHIWKLTAGTFAWTDEGNIQPSNCSVSGNCGQPLAAYDPVNKLVYMFDNDGPFFWSYSLATNTLTTLNSSYSGTVFNSGPAPANLYTVDIDPVRRLYVGCGGGDVSGNGCWKISLNSPYAATKLNMTNCGSLTTTRGPGFVYYPARGQFVGWVGKGSGAEQNLIYFYNPDTDSCTSVSYTGGPGAEQADGTFGRMRYDYGYGVFVVANSMTQDFFTLRLDVPSTANFGYRCNQPGVLNCNGFDNANFFSTAVDQTNLIDGLTTVPETNLTQDTTVSLSGGASAKFHIPPNSGENDTGNIWMYFGDGSKNQFFGQNTVFWVQYAFQADTTWTATDWTQYGATGNNTAPKLSIFHNAGAGSCAEEEVTMHDHNAFDLPTGYSNCGHNFLFTNTDDTTANTAGTPPYEYQSGSTTGSGFNCPYNSGNKPTGNCLFFTAGQWYSVTYKVTIGTWGTDPSGSFCQGSATKSTVEAWIAPYGSTQKKWINAHQVDLCDDTGTNGCDATGNHSGNNPCPGFNTMELTQFMTGKGKCPCPSGGNNSPAANVWYDEAIISSTAIADPATLPGGAGGQGPPPPPPPPQGIGFRGLGLMVKNEREMNEK